MLNSTYSILKYTHATVSTKSNSNAARFMLKLKNKIKSIPYVQCPTSTAWRKSFHALLWHHLMCTKLNNDHLHHSCSPLLLGLTLYWSVAGSTISRGLPFTLIRPFPLLQWATAVAVFCNRKFRWIPLNLIYCTFFGGGIYKTKLKQSKFLQL